jgi:hypothetical protein
MRSTQYTAGALLGLATIVALPSIAPAQDAFQAPTYSRMRTGADDWHARGGGRGPVGYGHGGYGGGYGFFQPYVTPVVTGSWYARPHPHHFDYFRGRWDRSAPMTDCPSEHGPAIDTQVLPADTP